MKSFTAAVPAQSGRSVPVVVGAGALDLLARELVERSRGGLVAIVSDANVAALHGVRFAAAVAGKAARAELFTFPPGEASKSRATKERLEDELLAAAAGRDTQIVALGGGITGDLAGFIAATLLRGVAVWQAPTTTLAMADAALGGKTAIDVPAGKNLVGAFHHPEGVFADLDTLTTLPDDVYRAGFAEVIKTAAIADAGLFERLEHDVERLLERDLLALEPVLLTCLEIKARVVSADERESGLRMILNFGHTIAHALESVSGFALPHGPAVAIGMCVEARLAQATTGFPAADLDRLERLIDAFGLPTRSPHALDSRALLAATQQDKKARAGRARYALPAALGSMPAGPAAIEVDPSIVAEVLGRG